MSMILVEGINHYAVVYSLNCRRLKDSVVGHQYAMKNNGGVLQGYLKYWFWV